MVVAERVGFEATVRLPVQRFSSSKILMLVCAVSSSRFPLPRCWLVMAGATRCRAVGFAKSLQQRLSVCTPKADQLDKKHCVQPACPLMAPSGHSESNAEANSTLSKPTPSVCGLAATFTLATEFRGSPSPVLPVTPCSTSMPALDSWICGFSQSYKQPSRRASTCRRADVGLRPGPLSGSCMLPKPSALGRDRP